MRVHELAKELGVSSKELLASLADMGVAGKSASSSVPEDLMPRLRASGGKATAAPAKPREVLEPPPQPRKPRAKPKPKGAPPAAAQAPPPPAPATPTPPPEPKQAPKQRRRPEPAAPVIPSGPVLQVIHGATPQAIAEKTDRSPAEIVKILFMGGDMVTATTSLTDQQIELVAAELGYTVEIVGLEDELKEEQDGEAI